MVMNVAGMVSAVRSFQTSPESEDGACMSASRSAPPRDISRGIGSNQQQPCLGLQSIPSPVFEALMTALSAAAATYLHLTRVCCAEDRQDGLSLMQALEHKHQRSALHRQAESALTACSEAAAGLLTRMPPVLRPSQLAFAVTSCPQAICPRQPIQSRASPALNGSLQTYQSSQQAVQEAPLHLKGCEGIHDKSQTHDGQIWPSTAQKAMSEDDSYSTAEAHASGLPDRGYLASENVLGLIGKVLLERQTCSHATQLALSRLIANLLTAQDISDTLLCTHQGSAADWLA